MIETGGGTSAGEGCVMLSADPLSLGKRAQRTRRSAKDALQVPASFYGLSSTHPPPAGLFHSPRHFRERTGETRPFGALLPGAHKTPEKLLLSFLAAKSYLLKFLLLPAAKAFLQESLLLPAAKVQPEAGVD